MKCKCNKKRVLEVFSVMFGCPQCHYILDKISFDILSTSELIQIKKECDYYLKAKKSNK